MSEKQSKPDWITLTPQRGRKVGAGEAVTMGWRRGRTSITLGGSVVTALGWPKKSQFVADYAREAGLLRLRRVEKDGWVLSYKSTTCAACMVPLPDVQSEPRKARQVEHRIEDGALILTLPAWARPSGAAKPAPAKAAPVKAAKPAPKPAAQAAAAAQPTRTGPATRLSEPVAAAAMEEDDRREAFESFNAGMGPRVVADELCIGLDSVVNWHAEWKRQQKAEGRAA